MLQVISSCIDVYADWLLCKPWAPAPVLAEPSTFIPAMVRHLSLLFEPRTTATDEYVGRARGEREGGHVWRKGSMHEK